MIKGWHSASTYITYKQGTHQEMR